MHGNATVFNSFLLRLREISVYVAVLWYANIEKRIYFLFNFMPYNARFRS